MPAFGLETSRLGREPRIYEVIRPHVGHATAGINPNAALK